VTLCSGSTGIYLYTERRPVETRLDRLSLNLPGSSIRDTTLSHLPRVSDTGLGGRFVIVPIFRIQPFEALDAIEDDTQDVLSA
jgi:hypothetical protein